MNINNAKIEDIKENNQMNTEVNISLKEIVIKKLQTGDQKSLLAYEDILKQFLNSQMSSQTLTFESRRECELFELITDLFSVSFTRDETTDYKVSIHKTEKSKIPSFDFSQFVQPVPQYKVLRRTPTTEISPAFNNLSDQSPENLKERQESYYKTRALIFGENPVEDPIPPEVPLQSEEGSGTGDYYTDDSAFVRCKRPTSQYSMSPMYPDYSYYSQPQFYQPNYPMYYPPPFSGQFYPNFPYNPQNRQEIPPPRFPPYRQSLYGPERFELNSGYPRWMFSELTKRRDTLRKEFLPYSNDPYRQFYPRNL